MANKRPTSNNCVRAEPAASSGGYLLGIHGRVCPRGLDKGLGNIEQSCTWNGPGSSPKLKLIVCPSRGWKLYFIFHKIELLYCRRGFQLLRRIFYRAINTWRWETIELKYSLWCCGLDSLENIDENADNSRLLQKCWTYFWEGQRETAGKVKEWCFGKSVTWDKTQWKYLCGKFFSQIQIFKCGVTVRAGRRTNSELNLKLGSDEISRLFVRVYISPSHFLTIRDGLVDTSNSRILPNFVSVMI